MKRGLSNVISDAGYFDLGRMSVCELGSSRRRNGEIWCRQEYAEMLGFARSVEG